MKKFILKVVESYKIVKCKSNNKLPKRHFEGSKGRIDGQRNKLRNNSIKRLIEKGIMQLGEKFGNLNLKNVQQVTAIMRYLKPLISEYVKNDLDYTTDEGIHKLKSILKTQNYANAQRHTQFYELHEKIENDKVVEKYATIKPLTSDLCDKLIELVIDQHIAQFTENFTKKVRG